MSDSAAFFAIRRKGTNLYLPRCDRGASHTEPVDWQTFVPRLFLSRQGANQALRAWCKGKWTVEHHSTDTPLGRDEYSTLEVEPVPGRDFQTMEIVPVYLRPSQSHILPKGPSNGK